MSKASKQEMIQREQRINQLIANSVPRAEIIRTIALEFKCTERAAKDQYYQVLNDMQKAVTEDRELIRQEIAIQLEQIQRDARGKGASKVEMEAAMNRAKLLGLNEKIESTAERPSMIRVTERDMSGKLEVVPTDKAENE